MPRSLSTVSLVAVFAAAVTAPAPGAAADPAGTIVAGPVGYTEGPAVGPDGSVWFTEAGPAHTIHRHDPASGQTTAAFDADASGGANGLLWDGDTLYIAEDRLAQVVSRRTGPGLTERTVLAADYHGEPFNGPNDLARHDASDTLFFTDPKYSKRPNRIGFEGVYAIRDGAVSLVTDQMQRPNGIAVRGDTLLVADNMAKTIEAFELGSDGTAGPMRRFADLSMHDGGGPDGMVIDPQGRVLVTMWGSGVHAYSGEGEHLGFVPTGDQTSNITLAADGGWWVTAQNSLLKVPASVIDAAIGTAGDDSDAEATEGDHPGPSATLEKLRRRSVRHHGPTP